LIDCLFVGGFFFCVVLVFERLLVQEISSEMLRYVLIVNKQGQTRMSQYYVQMSVAEKVTMEAELVRKCLGRNSGQCSVVEFRDHKAVYRRYASLFFIVGMDTFENEQGVFELIHQYLVTLDSLFDSVCELDIMLRLDVAHFVLDEMVINGLIVETNRATIADMVSHYLELE